MFSWLKNLFSSNKESLDSHTRVDTTKSVEQNSDLLDDELDPCTIGWDAITAECERVYPGQTDPMHFGTLISWRLGGDSPLDGISVYDDGDNWHFVTYGLSELYEKDSEDPTISGYGMEFTYRLDKASANDDEIRSVCGVLQQIAKFTFTAGEIFKPYEYLYSGQTEGIDSNNSSNIVGFITIPDAKLQTLDTPNGKLEFVEFIGVTNEELLAVKDKKMTVQELYELLGTDATSYNRNPVLEYNGAE